MPSLFLIELISTVTLTALAFFVRQNVALWCAALFTWVMFIPTAEGELMALLRTIWGAITAA